MAAPIGSAIHYLRVSPPLAWFIPLCALMGLSHADVWSRLYHINPWMIYIASIYGIHTMDHRLMIILESIIIGYRPII